MQHLARINFNSKEYSISKSYIQDAIILAKNNKDSIS